MKAQSHCHRGFSLVEIVLALGVASFALIAILGLLSMGINSNKCSLDECLVAAMSRQVVGDLRRQSFTNVTSGTAYFDANGTRLFTDTTDLVDISLLEALNRKAVYQCIVTPQGGNDFGGPLVPVTTPCMLNITLTFSWPVGAAKPNTSMVFAAIARY